MQYFATKKLIDTHIQNTLFRNADVRFSSETVLKGVLDGIDPIGHRSNDPFVISYLEEMYNYVIAIYHEKHRYPVLHNWSIVPTRDFSKTFPSYCLIGNLLSPAINDNKWHAEYFRAWDDTYGDTIYMKASLSPEEGYLHLTTSPIENFMAHKTGRMFVTTKNTTYELTRFTQVQMHNHIWNHMCLIDQLHDDQLHPLQQFQK